MNQESKLSIGSKITSIVTDYYLNSRDYNGIQIWNLLNELDLSWLDVRENIGILVKCGAIQIIDESTDENPNIIRWGFEDLDQQVAKIGNPEPGYMCLYPSTKTLASVVDPNSYRDEPYKLKLALGEAQLSHEYFDPTILEYYQQDPRYDYHNNDVSGRIDYSLEMPEKEHNYVKSFGFAYNKESTSRAVVVFRCYLAKMDKEHQRMWKMKEVNGEYWLHPDYYRGSILGEFPEKTPLCQAIMMELYVINRMSETMKHPKLFRKDYGYWGEDRPSNFHFLLRPTLERYNSFLILFDNLITENLNRKFFKHALSKDDMEETDILPDGRQSVKPKGTLALLDTWVRSKFTPYDGWAVWENDLNALRQLRNKRSKPAHSVNPNEWDEKYFDLQRQLMNDVYSAIRTIRLVLSNHPDVKTADVKIDEDLFAGEIWTR